MWICKRKSMYQIRFKSITCLNETTIGSSEFNQTGVQRLLETKGTNRRHNERGMTWTNHSLVMARLGQNEETENSLS